MRVFWPNSVFNRVKAHAVRLAHAIAAAFADVLVDDQAQRGLFQLAARALAALLGRALLIVDDDRDAWDLLQLAQALPAVRRGRARRHWRPAAASGGTSRDRRSERRSCCTPSASSLRVRRGPAERRRHPGRRSWRRAVVQNLVGDVDARGHAGFDGERTRNGSRCRRRCSEKCAAVRRTATCRSTARLRRPCASGTRSRGSECGKHAAMPWQPMPPPATWPSSSSVERLCGQPEQKFGARLTDLLATRAAISAIRSAALRCDSRCGRISSWPATFDDRAPDRARPSPAAAAARPRLACRRSAVAAGRCTAPRGAAARGSCVFLRRPGWSRARRRIRAAKRGSSGKVMPNLAMRMPSASRSSRRMPRSRSACIRS